MRDAKQRLRSLDRIDPPDVWHRAGSMEPLGDLPDTVGQPPWQRRVAAGAVAFAVFGVAVALALGAFDRDDPRVGIGDATPLPADVVVTFEVIETNDSSHPSATMTAGDATVDGVITSYSWSFAGGETIRDTVEFVCTEMAAATGAQAPSFTSWRSGVAKKYGITLDTFAGEIEPSPKTIIIR